MQTVESTAAAVSPVLSYMQGVLYVYLYLVLKYPLLHSFEEHPAFFSPARLGARGSASRRQECAFVLA